MDICHGLLLFQVYVRKGRVDPFVDGVQSPPWKCSNVDSYEKSAVPAFLLDTYFAQNTGIEKGGFCEIHTRNDVYSPNKNGRISKTSICHICEFA